MSMEPFRDGKPREASPPAPTRDAARRERLPAVLLVALCWSLAAFPHPGASETASNVVALVVNGDFEREATNGAARPEFWDLPDGLGVQWTQAPGEEHGRAIRMNTAISETAMVAQWRARGLAKWDIPKPANDPVAATYGLSYYSDSMPVVSGQAYRVSFDFNGPSGGAKVWVRGYGQFKGRERRRYETIVNCRAPAGEWTHFEQTFHPTKMRGEVTEMRVMLYAYWPPGVYWFDNVSIEPISAEAYAAEHPATAAPRDEAPP